MIDERVDTLSFTVSLFGAKNATGIGGTTTIGDVNSDDALRRNM